MSKEQRIKEAESNEAWAVFSDRNKYLSLSDEQIVMVDAFVDAGQIKQETGEWPTLAEVYEKWGREKAERERKRVASWQDTGMTTEYDFTCYAERLVAGDDEGPFMTFMSVAAHLKQSTGNFPTVGEVRAHCEANQKAV
jgi:hypothetical protein